MFNRCCRTLLNEWRATLIDVQTVSPTTRWLRFESDELQHTTISSISANILLPDGEVASGFYTPITTRSHKGYFDLLVKLNRGLASQCLHTLYSGHRISFGGPHLHARYIPNKRKCMTMIAGGTGLRAHDGVCMLYHA